MARAVNGVTAQVQILPVATILRNRSGNTAVTVLRVVSNQVVSTGSPHGRASILNIELERVHNTVSNVQLQRRLPLPPNVRSVRTIQSSQTERTLVIQLSEVTRSVNSGIIRGGSNAVDRTVEVRAPVPIHLAVRKLNTSGTTRVSVRLRSIALHVGEVTANIQVTILNQQSLHLCGIAIATLNLKIPRAVNLTGGRVQNDEVVNLLAIHLGKFAANCQAVIRQSLKSLNLAVESRAEGTNQLTRIHVVTSQVRLINALAASRLHILEVATGEDGVAYLSNSLNVSVHLVLLAGASLFTGAPTNGHRVAIGQSTTVAGGRARTNLREVQVTLSQLRAQEHLSEGDRVTEGTALLVNV